MPYSLICLKRLNVATTISWYETLRIYEHVCIKMFVLRYVCDHFGIFFFFLFYFLISGSFLQMLRLI